MKQTKATDFLRQKTKRILLWITLCFFCVSHISGYTKKGSPFVRIKKIYMLAKKNTVYISQLLPFLESNNSKIRDKAIKTFIKLGKAAVLSVLGKIKNKQALYALFIAMKDKDYDLEETAIKAYASMAGKQAIPLLIKIFKTQNGATAESLFRIGKPVIPFVIPLLKHTNTHVRNSAVTLLGEFRLKRLTPLLLPLLKDPKRTIRHKVIEVLGWSKDPRVVPHLIKFLDKRGSLNATIIALGNAGSQQAVPHLIRQLKKYPEFYGRIFEALSNIGSNQTFYALKKLLRQKKISQEYFTGICYTFSTIQDKRAVPVLI